jgi:surface antigen
MMMSRRMAIVLAASAPLLAGCGGLGLGGSGAPAPMAAAYPVPPTGAVVAAPVAAPLTAPPPAAVAAAPLPTPIPTGTALGGALGGPIGASLSDADRSSAWNAQIAALDSGQRKSWRGAHGVFGFVEPGAETGGGCRAYSQTIYVSGRPNKGQGVGCKQADGSWNMSG